MSALDVLERLEGIDAGSLNPLQRILIITDGTLTEILEATFLERIRLMKVSQQTISSTAAHIHVAPDPGEALLERKIVLRGEGSNRNYVYAESIIAINRLPASLRNELVSSDVSLGRLWLEHKLETFKELLEVKSVQAGKLCEHFDCGNSGAVLVRTYRVHSAAMPVMVISEYFPVEY
jgi:chorismate-pyruvate lyase